MLRNVLILLALAATVALPFALRPRDSALGPADESLVIITPHNEAIRAEFTRGFRAWYQARTGRTVRLDWRTPGGTSEIARYLAGEYEAPFENYWKNTLHRPWTDVVQKAFDNPRINPQHALENHPTPKPADTPPSPMKLSAAETARWAFLNSEVGIGIDLFFGGGSYDFIQQAAAGRLVDSGFVHAHPELFNDSATGIPQSFGGEPFYDKDGRWFGNVVSAFGICFNVDQVQTPLPENWRDLADPRFLRRVALADPNKSASVAKVFEIIIQQQMQLRALTAAGGTASALADGWEQAMRIFLRMGANTRYFTDSATKIPIDVAQGDAALGVCIDFYGRFESENARNHSGRERLRYFNPVGGTSIGVDSIGLLRGAPHRQVALLFMEYVMSLDGQKLWNWKVGAPGGPERYALRRLPIRRELYAEEYKIWRADPEVYPYEEAKNFAYHPEWTGALFNPIRFIVRVLCVDPHDEARDAWSALIAANFPPEATRVFEDVSAVSYAEAKGRIATALKDPDKLAEARLAAELSEHFRAQYRRAAEMARAGK
ncbi:MAG: extracellular solute-binding protein [Verrucomicrobia bacterium]|nr:extracellular solute-binding protein [Verrucomicrobiota bacterium]